MNPLLQLDDIRVRFRTRSSVAALVQGVSDPFVDAVHGVSLQIEAGQTYGLVGESGSGKTTLARTIMGLLKPDEGRILFNGTDLSQFDHAQKKHYHRQMGTLFQDPVGSLSPRMSIGALLSEPFKIHHIKQRNLAHEVSRLLELVGLPSHFASRYPHQLSGGQARRVGVARAIALQPALIIADEPTAGLDVSIQGEILNLLSELQQELGVSILVITHNLNVVRHITDRMGIMYLGRLLEQGQTRAIFEQPRHPYTLALLSANPEPDPDAVINRIELPGEVPSLLERPGGCEFHPRCPFSENLCQATVPELTVDAAQHEYRCHFPRH